MFFVSSLKQISRFEARFLYQYPYRVFFLAWIRGVQQVAFYGTGSPASLWNYGTGLPDARLAGFTYYR